MLLFGAGVLVHILCVMNSYQLDDTKLHSYVTGLVIDILNINLFHWHGCIKHKIEEMTVSYHMPSEQLGRCLDPAHCK